MFKEELLKCFVNRPLRHNLRHPSLCCIDLCMHVNTQKVIEMYRYASSRSNASRIEKCNDRLRGESSRCHFFDLLPHFLCSRFCMIKRKIQRPRESPRKREKKEIKRAQEKAMRKEGRARNKREKKSKCLLLLLSCSLHFLRSISGRHSQA